MRLRQVQEAWVSKEWKLGRIKVEGASSQDGFHGRHGLGKVRERR